MQDYTSEQELRDRLSLIERMLAEGRRHMESWGWTFVLWGVAYYVAIAWSAWGSYVWAWPITMLIAVVVTVAGASLKTRNHPATTLSRAIDCIWVALGVSAFSTFFALGLSGRLVDQHVFMAMMSGILGMANGSSALILRWKAQFGCAVVWWVTAAVCCFGSVAQSKAVFLVAIFLCQIVFGIYGAFAGVKKRKGSSAAHARFA